MWPSVNGNVLTNQIDIRSEKTHDVTRCKQALKVAYMTRVRYSRSSEVMRSLLSHLYSNINISDVNDAKRLGSCVLCNSGEEDDFQ